MSNGQRTKRQRAAEEPIPAIRTANTTETAMKKLSVV